MSTPRPTIPNIISTLRAVSDDACLKRVEPRQTARDYHRTCLNEAARLLAALEDSPDVLKVLAK